MMNAVARIVTRLYYRNPRGVGDTQSVLAVQLNSGEEFAVDNGVWDEDSPALRLMAFLGVRPSTLDEAEGSVIPVTYERVGDEIKPQPHRVIFEEGARSLKSSEWGPGVEDATEIDVAMPDEA